MAGQEMNTDYLAAVGIIVIIGIVIAWVWLISGGFV